MDITYKIEYRKRKNITISVERDKTIIVKAPPNTSIEYIDKCVNQKRLWLYNKLNHSQKYKEKQTKEFINGSSVYYLGRHYKLEVVDDNSDGIYFRSKFYLSKNSLQLAEQLLQSWYRSKAEEKIRPKIRYFAENLGVQYNSLMITDMKYRWGSCTPKNNINFNWRLIKAPSFVIDYIVVHELTHLIETNHTKKFWDIVSIQLPNYQKAKEWLKDFGELLDH